MSDELKDEKLTVSFAIDDYKVMSPIISYTDENIQIQVLDFIFVYEGNQIKSVELKPHCKK